MKFKKVLAFFITGTMTLTMIAVSALFTDPLLAKAFSGSPSDMIEPLSDEPAETPTTGEEVPAETPTTGEEAPAETPTTGQEVPEETPTTAPEAPEETLTTGPEVPEETPTTAPEAPEETPTTGEEVPEETPTTAPEAPAETPTTGEEVPEETPTTGEEVPEETPTTGPEAPEETPTTAPEAPEETPTTGEEVPEETPTTAPEAPTEIPTETPTTAPTETPSAAPPLPVSSLKTSMAIKSIAPERTGTEESEYASNSILSLGNSMNVTPVGQGGNVIINGEPTNVTFTLAQPSASNIISAKSLADSITGKLLNVVSVGTTVSFDTATVNFYVPGVVSGQDIQVFQYINGQWKRVNIVEIREDHIIVDMTATGVLAFIDGGVKDTIAADRGAGFGNLQSRLEHTISNVDVENSTVAESRIRDVDMEKEMAAYTKNNILVQSSQAMLAQANQVPQSVLGLLQ